MIKSLVKQDLLFFIKSKYIMFFIGFSVLVYLALMMLAVSGINYSYKEYLRSEDFYVKEGYDIDEMLRRDYILDKTEYSTTVENPLAYYKEILSLKIDAMKPFNIVFLYAESSVIIIPVVFFLLGLTIGLYEYKYRTLKLKITRSNKLLYGISKNISLIILSVISSLAIIVLLYLMDIPVYEYIKSIVPVNNFNHIHNRDIISDISKISFCFFISLLFSIIGYTLAVIVKNPVIPSLIIFTYVLAIPNLGKYDLKNMINFVSSKVFEFNSVLNISKTPHEISLILALGSLILIFIITFFLNMISVNKMSAYN